MENMNENAEAMSWEQIKDQHAETCLPSFSNAAEEAAYWRATRALCKKVINERQTPSDIETNAEKTEPSQDA